MQTAAQVRGDAVVVRVTDEIDVLTGEQLSDAVEQVLGGPLVVVDLTGVSFLGSRGMTVLLQVKRSARAVGTDLRFVLGANRVVRRALTMAGLLDQFIVCDDVEQAVRGDGTTPPA